MSVVYRSWEVASGPTMGYNMSIQGNMCATADTLIPEASNYSSNTLLSHEAFMIAVAAGSDVSKGLTFPNHKTHSPQDSVVRGFSSLSLHPQLQLSARSPSEDCKTTPSCELSNKSFELNCNNLLASNQKNFNCFAARLAGNHMQGRVSASQKSMHHESSGFHSFEGALGGSGLLSHSDRRGSTSSNTCRVATKNFLPLHDYGDFESYDCTNAYHRPKLTLDVVVEDKPFEENSTAAVNDYLELDAVSTSSTNSVSSLHEPVDGSVSSGEGLFGVGECEVQSAYKGSSTLTGGCSPPRKGLSRFYAGKSRSFSCLGDVMSLRVRDLAKPENPHAKKRRCHVGRSVIAGRPQLPPLQKGAASISKKAVHNGKSTLALAVAMSTREVVIDVEMDDQSFLGTQSWQRTSRSYSLSDLQRAAENQVSSS